MSALDVEDFLQQNRALADQVETFRGYWESDKHWGARREFILRNINEYDFEQLDHLLSLSMVWANNVFMGCRYSTELLDKVKEMAEGIVVVDAPVFKTRDEIIKKQQVRMVDDQPTSCRLLWLYRIKSDGLSCYTQAELVKNERQKYWDNEERMMERKEWRAREAQTSTQLCSTMAVTLF
ncbi:hypothetical protein INR49_005965, partial [Caranx melampygus]